MTRQEFDDTAKERGFEIQITNDDYSVIERVYNFHPSISSDSTEGKKQIVDLVGLYGMRIIRDMEPTARKAQQLDDEIRSYRYQLDMKMQELEDLRRGVD